MHGRDAGAFGAWLDGTRAAIRGERDADVPCDGCDCTIWPHSRSGRSPVRGSGVLMLTRLG